MSPVSDPIAEIKARLDVVDVIGQKVTLKRSGSTYKGLCPFHSEKTPSFIVFPDKGNYHCFGCGASGDVFSFVMKTENLDFPETLRVLAARAGGARLPRGPRNRLDDDRTFSGGLGPRSLGCSLPVFGRARGEARARRGG